MPKLAPIEGRKLIKILCNEFGFRPVRQKGSHVTITNGRVYVTVPAKLIGVGLLSIILKDCDINRERFLENL
ncbi:MAG TPA: type II toxin-antitoxin system HicA family toxin [Nitrososphaerales archaeon]|nr:type II toxin-antitoxin system HicA family toxin [Nitrososphaerales archaeon]